MSTNKRGDFLREKLTFWLFVLAACCIVLVITTLIYNESAITYYSIDSIPEPHKSEIIFMRQNGYTVASTWFYNYDFIDGDYIVNFGFFYNLAWLLVVATTCMSVFYGYYYLEYLVKKHRTKAGKRQVNHIVAVYQFEKEMRNYRFQKNNSL